MQGQRPAQDCSLLNLPAELLLTILGNLDYRALLRCCSVCRELKGVVGNHTELQYLIELGVDGLVDCPSPLPVADRLRMLQERRQAWQELRWTRCVPVDIPGHCQAYELVGGMFAKTTGPARHFYGVWLPTRDAPGYQVEHKDIGLVTRDFAIDPTQDLIAYMVVDHDTEHWFSDHQVHVHLRTIETNAPHPLAPVPVLHRSIPFPISNAFMQIVDDVVGLFTWNESTRIMIWNWKTGTLMVLRTEKDLPDLTADFSFLSSRAYMAVSRAEGGMIVISTFGEPSASSRCARLMLPPVNAGVSVSHITTHTGPFTAHPPAGRPFTTSADSRLHYFSIEYARTVDEPLEPRFRFFVHNRTFLSYASSWMTHADAKVPWDDWGIMNTRFQRETASFQWLRYIHGQRFVFQPPGEASGIVVYDFNVTTRGQIPPTTWNGWRQATGSRIHRPPTRIMEPHIFARPVHSALPFRYIHHPNLKQYVGFMIDEARLIGLQSPAFSDGPMKAIDVYTL